MYAIRSYYVRVLRKEDIIAIIRVLLDLKDGKGEIDDIDHLGVITSYSIHYTKLYERRRYTSCRRTREAVTRRFSRVTGRSFTSARRT